MALDTDLNVSPYFDDFDESKNFHRILFKPATAVQARELTQVQTILQNQIERFGNHIFKNGSIVDGAGVSFYNKLHFTRLQDYTANGNLLDVTQLVGSTIESNDTGLRGVVMTINTGTEVEYPYTNRVYVRYINSGTDTVDNSDVKEFLPNEMLTFYTGPRSANVQLAIANTFSNVASNTYTSSYGMGVQVSDGLIYQKGFFVRLEEQVAVVSDTRDAGNTLVGFVTNEQIINSDQDESLLDNALGYTNANAPGADRLKLVANLAIVSTESLANTADFTPIAQYIAGVPVMKETDASYAKLGDKMAADLYGHAGDFVIKPFTVDTKSHASNNELFVARISPGIAFAQGHRVELFAAADVDIKRGADTDSAEAQLISTNYGNFVIADEFGGSFDFAQLNEIDLYDTYQLALTNGSTTGTFKPSPTGTKIGTATVRSVVPYDGVNGDPSAQFAVYLFNIQMNTTKSFSDVKALVKTGSEFGMADLTSPTIYNAERRGMIWGFGKSGIARLTDENGNVDTQFVYRKKNTGTIQLGTNGNAAVTITGTHAGGSDVFASGVGVVGDTNERRWMIVAAANGETVAATSAAVTSGGNTVYWSTPADASKFAAGEYIKINSLIRRIVSKTSNTTHVILDTNAAITGGSGQTVKKYFPEGYVFPLNDTMPGTRRVTINTTTSATITIDTGYALSAPLNLTVYHDVLRNDALPAKKVINKNVLVHINTGNNVAGNTGPWTLGMPDVHKIRAVYSGNTASGQDYLSRFYFESGQTDTHYDHAKLYLRPGMSLPANTFTVAFDAFGLNTTGGVGYFSIDSYPIDDANTANVSAITTAEIPLYTSETGKTFNLRDSVDFRPYRAATANVATTVSTKTTNPAAANAWSIATSGTHVPSPDMTFQADIEFYLGRKDMVYFSSQGYLKVKQGVSTENPVFPSAPADGMPIAYLNIPPYPSLTSGESAVLSTASRTAKSLIRDTSSRVTVSLATNRRYTMKDIGALDQRLTRVEYYSTLNMLEKSATDINVPDANGLNRFKNGIFVEPFTSHGLGDVSNPEYKISIDPVAGVARPFFKEDRTKMDYDFDKSMNITQTSRLLTLPYESVLFAEQVYATKYRNAAPMQFHWAGKVEIFPEYDSNVDTINAPAVNVTIDNASPWIDFANSPFGTNYGEWRTTNVNTSVVNSSNAVKTAAGTTTTSATTTSITTTENQTIDQLHVGTSSTNYNLGEFVTDVQLSPFIRSREIAFHGWSLRPSTTYHVFFDEVLVDAYCAVGTENLSITSTDDDRRVTRTAAWGTPLKTNANGEIFGKLIIPAGQFRVGEREFLICDTDDLLLGADSVTSSGATSYVGNSISVTKQSTTMTTVNPVLSTSSITRAKSSTTSSTSTNVTVVPVTPPPKIVIKTVTKPAPVKVDPVVPVQPAFVPPPSNGEAQGGGNSGGGDAQSDPLAQMFRVAIDANLGGLFLTELDVFFKQKPADESVGLTVYITEVLNGYPDNTRILPFSTKRLRWGDINVSNNGQSPTTFTFEAPIYLANGRQYAFVTFPDGGHPDYLVWMAELGANDVASGVQVFSKPYVDTAFYSANQSTWTALQNEYVKFRVRRAEFHNGYGIAYLKNRPTEYLQTDGLTLANTSMVEVRAGDRVVSATNGTVSNANTLVVGYVQMYNPNDGTLHLTRTTGNWTGKNYLQVHRTATDVSGISNSTLVAHASLTAIGDLKMNAIVPRFATIQPAGTVIRYKFEGTKTNHTNDGFATSVPAEVETELYDYERIIASRSNEVNYRSSNNSLWITAEFATETSYLSPVIDMVRSEVLAVANQIDDLSFDLSLEHGNYGTIQSKYVSKPVLLADGQDAEDLMVYITAYRPQQSDVKVYGRFLNSEDAEGLTDKAWTLLEIDNGTLYSDYRNTRDYREYLYRIPATIPAGSPVTVATLNGTTGISYNNSTGSTYNGFKAFAIKVVLQSDNTSRVPRLPDIRAIALQM